MSKFLPPDKKELAKRVKCDNQINEYVVGHNGFLKKV